MKMYHYQPVKILVVFFTAIVFFSACSVSPRTEKDFFNKKDLTGWSASQMQYWSVEDGAIVGKSLEEVPRNQFLWSSVKVKDFYLNLDVRLDSADRNAGIQFRSSKVDDYGQATGYQADIGLNWGVNIWGTLYHEDGRGLLQTADPEKSTVKNGEWNHYEILASGDRIWIAVNGQIVTATEDKNGLKEGYIALQIHSGPAQTVKYRIHELIHNPKISMAGKTEQEMTAMLHKPLVPSKGQPSIDLKSGDIVAFAGGTNIANMMDDGYLETLLTAYFSKSPLKFRNVGWDGDQVYEQFRDVGFGNWMSNLDSLKANIIFVQFGQMEALQGAAKLPEFLASYKKLLDTLKMKGKQVVIVSPVSYEPNLLKVNDSAQWNNPLTHTDEQKYFNAIQLMAQTEGYPFIDLYWTLKDDKNDVTYDGIHLADWAQKVAAEITMKSMGLEKKYTADLDALREAINQKNRIWFNYWRPGNWAFLNGDRTEQAFSRHWKDGSKRIFPEEVKRFAPLLEEAEKKIEQLQKETEKEKQPAPKAEITPPPVSANDSSIAEELSSFRLDKNFNIELYASEALGIADPCTMRWDEKGRLWVLCIPTYPQPLPGQPANDRLVVLEDKNKDGKADASTVFAENLNIPLGFELGHNGVYLGEQTRLLFLKDTNNDLKSDTRQTLLSGFGTHDSHQTINSFTWSPGGELFFAQGLSIHSYVETPWGVKKAHRGGLWRYRPMAHQLDNILDQSTASDNPWGMTFGDWGEYFTKSNDTGVYFTSPALVLTDHQALVPEIGATQIKSGIVEMPRSSHLPADIQGDFLIAGYYNNKVERMKVSESGAGYKARLVEPLLSSVSKNFRPVDIKTGPDGAIYILDWYNPIIGHYQASLRDPQRDKTHGRIWRITAKGKPLVTPTVLEDQPITSLLNALTSREYQVRYQARRLLASRPAREVLPAVTAWINNLPAADAQYEHHLMEAIAVYENFETVNEPLLRKLSKARNAGARGYAAQLAGRWSDRLAQPLEYIRPFITDPHPRVRLMALVACSQVHLPESMNLAVKILQYPTDKFTTHAFEKTVFALKNTWEPAFRDNKIKFRNNKELAAVISILTPHWYTPGMYRDLLGAGEYASDTKTKLLSALSDNGRPEDLEYILSLPFAKKNAFLLEEMGKKEVVQVTSPAVKSITGILTQPASEEVTVAAIKLAKSWNIQSLFPVISKIVQSPGQKEKTIAQGITTAVALGGNAALPLLDRFSASPAKRIRLACVNGYSKIDIQRGAVEMVKEMKKGSGDVNEMRETIINIIYEPGGIAALTNEISKEGLSSNLASAALIALDQRHISDKGLLQAISRFESKKENAVPKDYDEAYIKKMADQVKSNGHAAEGQKVYLNKLSCNVCHKLGDKGGNIGPNLSAVGSGLSVSDIITEVLWPNKNIKEGYYSVRLELKNGETMQGIKVLENAVSISIKSTPAAAPVVVNKKDILKTEAVGSSMPEGLANAISEEELVNVIKYLSEQRNK